MKTEGAAYLVNYIFQWNDAGIYNHTLAWDLGARGMYSHLIFNELELKKNNFLV